MAPTPVAVGLPVYNGELYIEQALGSLLSQSFGDFSILVSDNGSTDATPTICRDVASGDGRVVYTRHEHNRGAAWNFNFTLARSVSPYFMWAAHDDLWEPTFIETCVRNLDSNPAAPLSFTAVRTIDETGIVLQPFVSLPPGVSDPNRAVRVSATLRSLTCSQVYGLMRRSCPAVAKGVEAAWSSDVRFLLRLSLIGPTAVDPAVLYSNRVYQSKTLADMARAVSGPPLTGNRVDPRSSPVLRDFLVDTWADDSLSLANKMAVGSAVVGVLYSRTTWRAAVLAQSAEAMHEDIRAGRFGSLARRTLLRTALAPSTVPVLVRKALAGSL